jgi:hypothetical protein
VIVKVGWVMIYILFNFSCLHVVGLENREYGCRGYTVPTTRHPSIRKSWH